MFEFARIVAGIVAAAAIVRFVPDIPAQYAVVQKELLHRWPRSFASDGFRIDIFPE
jgi:hypothetical protein